MINDLLTEPEGRAVIALFYDIMNRYRKTMDPVFVDVFTEFESRYNQILEAKFKELCIATSGRPSDLDQYILRREVPDYGFNIAESPQRMA